MSAIRFKNFSLHTQATQVKAAPTKLVEPALNHVIVIDVSGSMYSDLPGLRTQLKNKLVSLVKDQDTVTMIWFSGRDQYGVLLEGEPIRTLTDLSAIHKAIDRFLVPQGLTGFKQPLEEVSKVIGRLSKKNNHSFSMFFMTDGYDNQWGRQEILKAAQALESLLVNATFVEYGWNAHRELINKMAETVGGNHIFSENLSAYQVIFEKELSKRSGGKKIEVRLKTPAAFGFVYATDKDGGLITFAVENNAVRVPESVSDIHYFTRTKDGNPLNHDADNRHVYAGLATLSQRMLASEIFEVLADLGDVALVNKFVNCFSKQDYSEFETLCLNAAHNPDHQYLAGYDTDAVPPEDAYTVLEALRDLADDDENLLYVNHEAFGYKRIGAARVDVADTVTDKEVNLLAEKVRSANKADDLNAIKDEIDALQASKVKLVFEKNDKDAGVPISKLVYNSDRPNVSILTRSTGSIKLPENQFKKLPERIDSFIYRNYTIIRDGIVHTRVLPVSLAKGTFDLLQSEGLLKGEKWKAGKVYVLDLSPLPVINRQMVKNVTAKDLCTKLWKLQQLKAEQKVFNDAFKSDFERVSESYALLYGEDAANWLKEIGITDYNGFNPKTVAGEFDDVYVAKILKTSIKGLSSLPKVEEVRKKLAALGGKKPKDALTISQWIMVPAIERLDEFKASKAFQSSKNQDALLGNWLDAEKTEITKQTRALMLEIAQIKFAVVVGHVWFQDLGSLDNTTYELDVGFREKAVFNLLLEDKEIGGKDKD